MALRNLAGDLGTVTWSSRRTNSLCLTVMAKQEAVLLLRERWGPGWTATVNGARADVLRVAGLRAVRVPAGQSKVRLTYWPRLFFAELFLISLPAAGVIVFFLARAIWGRHANRRIAGA